MAPKRTGKEGGKGFAWGVALASQAIDAEDARLMAVKGSIQESTFRQYASSLQPLLGFLSTVRGNESLDVETLIRSLTVEELTSFAGTCMSADKTLPSGVVCHNQVSRTLPGPLVALRRGGTPDYERCEVPGWERG